MGWDDMWPLGKTPEVGMTTLPLETWGPPWFPCLGNSTITDCSGHLFIP